MSISILGLIIALILICLAIWATGKLLAAFAIPQPLATVIYVIVVIVCVLMALAALGVMPLGVIRLG